jgi:hypothetical protein
MTDFNPLAGAILGSTQAQNVLGAEKQRQLRRTQALRKDVAAGEDRYEHQVESAEELHPIDDGDPNHSDPHGKRRQPQRGEKDEEPGIDVTA